MTPAQRREELRAETRAGLLGEPSQPSPAERLAATAAAADKHPDQPA
jgi:hypothetical protein